MNTTLPRRISFWSAVAILVGSTIGSGIFRSPAGIADRLPAPVPLLGVWVVGGMLALCGALTLAEVSGAFPDTGGLYVFIREGWGELPAFLFGWAELVIIRAAALGALSTAFAEYLIRVLGYDPRSAPYDHWVHYIAAAAIAVVGWLNCRGVRWGTLLQNATTLIKCGGLLVLVVLALALGRHAAGGHPLPSVPVQPPTSSGIVAFGLALVSVLWVYDGWADVSFVAGEVDNPTRNLPRVLLLGTVLVIAIYVLVNVAYLTVLPISELRHSHLVAADVADRLVGRSGVVAIGLIVMISTFGTLNGSMITGPRVLWAMAHDGLLFKALAKVHPRYETPYVAILVTMALGIVFVSLQTFEQLADTFVTAILPFYALAVAAVFPLRQRASYHPPFRTLGYPVTPIFFIAATLYLFVTAFADPTARVPTGVVFLVILAGIPVYRVIKKNRRSS
ncbi:MAG TPA: amino acid permease [Gemmatimonadaceae bacterium]|nr:amino acid permease [Gemmatimonadaceae bacterium]